VFLKIITVPVKHSFATIVKGQVPHSNTNMLVISGRKGVMNSSIEAEKFVNIYRVCFK